MLNLCAKRVLVTGGGGFLGSHVVEALARAGCQVLFAPRKHDYDLTQPAQIGQLFRDYHPEVVIHLAAVVGGIEANRRAPGQFFYENAIMGIELMEQARRNKVEKFVQVGTVCAYPKHTPLPFQEERLWEGYPEETNAPYGLAKKILLVQAQAYRQQYGFNAIYLLPVNLYGPRDHFDPISSHVIPALIGKCLAAVKQGEQVVELWGDGTPTREFLYVEDAAQGIVQATVHYDGPEPVNLGTGQEISIQQLAEVISELCGFQGRLVFNADQPNGQPRRCLETSKARDYFGFQAKTSLRAGLQRTIEWYTHVLEGTETKNIPAVVGASGAQSTRGGATRPGA